jgi:hypothetical protein
VLSTPHEASAHVDSDDFPPVAGPLVALFGQTVADCRIDMTGALTISFDNGTTIHVPIDDQYEAWTLNSGQQTLVAMIGGGVNVYGQPTP